MQYTIINSNIKRLGLKCSRNVQEQRNRKYFREVYRHQSTLANKRPNLVSSLRALRSQQHIQHRDKQGVM